MKGDLLKRFIGFLGCSYGLFNMIVAISDMEMEDEIALSDM